MKTAKRVFRVIRNVLAAACGILAAVMVILYAAGNRYYVVQSGSMEPAIMTGSIEIVNTHYDYEKVTPGEIVCYKSLNDKLVTHRVIDVTPEGLETKGDANTLSDGISVTPENYHGRVWTSIPYAGFAAERILGRRGKIIIITALVVIMLISLLPGSDDSRKRNTKGTGPGHLKGGKAK